MTLRRATGQWTVQCMAVGSMIDCGEQQAKGDDLKADCVNRAGLKNRMQAGCPEGRCLQMEILT